MRLFMGLGFGTFLGTFSAVFASAPVFNDFTLPLPPSSHTVETMYFPIPQGVNLSIIAPFGDVTVVEQPPEDWYYAEGGAGDMPLASLRAEFSGQLPSAIFVKYPVLEEVPPKDRNLSVDLMVRSQGIEGWEIDEMEDTNVPLFTPKRPGVIGFFLNNFVVFTDGQAFGVEKKTFLPKTDPQVASTLKLTLNVPSPLLRLMYVNIMDEGSFTLQGLPFERQTSYPHKKLFAVLTGNSKKIKIENYSGHEMQLVSDKGCHSLENITLSESLHLSLGDPRIPIDFGRYSQDNGLISLRHLNVKSLHVENKLGSTLVTNAQCKEGAVYSALGETVIQNLDDSKGT